MENIYSEEQKSVKAVRAGQQTVRFLLSYSRSIKVIEHRNKQFELSLN